MVEVYTNLYVGNQDDFLQTQPLFKDWAVVHACKEPFHRNLLGYTGRAAPKDDPRYLFGYDRIGHLVLNIVDCDNPTFFADVMIDEAINYAIKNLKEGRKVLIHCNQGESRAPSIAFLILRKLGLLKETFSESIVYFRTLYPIYNPGLGIYKYLEAHWNEN